MIFVHGVSNDFEDGVATLANLWHYSGRQSLPISYSWPAGNPGLLRYFRDVGAGEFSVFHVKEFLRLLASVPEVKRIDIVAHSRGNAVVTDALRELLIEARAGGHEPRDVLKTGILVMAARIWILVWRARGCLQSGLVNCLNRLTSMPTRQTARCVCHVLSETPHALVVCRRRILKRLRLPVSKVKAQ